MKKIILTGGGTAGHVTPNIALIDKLQKEGYDIYYIGSKTGMEKDLIGARGIRYYGISCGKLRRYMDIKNVTDAVRVVKGVFEAVSIIKKISPQVIFSKGGFVAVPVAVAAKILNIPLIIHESDITPGLANKIAIPFAKAVCASFPETLSYVKKENVFLTGTPIRKELFNGNKEKGFALCGFTEKRPTVLVIGGSQGSIKINAVLRQALPALLKSYNIIHICGRENVDKALLNTENYKQFEYLGPELAHIYALSDMVVSRAGANSIYEFLALKKPNLLIPLSRNASRGDQILNAASFEKQSISKVLPEEELNENSLVLNIIDLYSNRDRYVDAMADSNLSDGVAEVVKIINKFSKKSEK